MNPKINEYREQLRRMILMLECAESINLSFKGVDEDFAKKCESDYMQKFAEESASFFKTLTNDSGNAKILGDLIVDEHGHVSIPTLERKPAA